jgi:two-component system, OmpR family, phosphate regulon sensor histidine kinase PhoR
VGIGRTFLTLLAIAGVPVLALLALAATGAATPLGAAIAIVVIVVVAFLLALLWGRDLAVLSETVRLLAEDQPTTDKPALPGFEQLGREIERLSRRLAERSAMLAQLRRADEAIVERLPDPLIVLGTDRSVRRANSAAVSMLGADLPAVLRHPVLRGAIDRAFAQGDAQSVEVSLPVPMAREVQATVVPMDPPLADGGRAVVVVSDRSRERAIERMRADFAANASHELRTPLTSLIGFIDTLRGPAKDDLAVQQRFLDIMAEQAARMTRLIDDMLSLSRVELMEHQAPSERIDLADLLRRQVAGFEPRLAERNVTLDLVVPPTLPAVLGDTDQLAQVVQNLLDNALKYGRDNGSIRCAIEPAIGARWPTRPGVVMGVTDQGQGIPREHLPRLTERFYRVDKGRSRAVGGTGLGLAIVKHIVNRHRGLLVIDSDEGVGTTVRVWLPAG